MRELRDLEAVAVGVGRGRQVQGAAFPMRGKSIIHGE
jgi:hypothetical protein